MATKPKTESAKSAKEQEVAQLKARIRELRQQGSALDLMRRIRDAYKEVRASTDAGAERDRAFIVAVKENLEDIQSEA